MKQAPALAQRSQHGDLPKLADRLPDKPLILQPLDQEGSYGGELRMGLLGGGDAWRLDWIMTYENLVRWDLDFEDVEPNVAESVDANADGTKYTFRLRPGMKWSDGKPFTADDVIFAQNDVLSDTGLYPAGPAHPGKATKLDDRTVILTLEEPDGLFLQQLASEPRNVLTQTPRHYLKQFHAKYSKNADQAAKREGFSDWTELFLSKMDLGQNTEQPTLYPWLLHNAVGKGSRVEFNRNPYYWKTDPHGRQLPYLDRVVFDLINDNQALLLKTMHGDIDLVDRYVNRLQNKPVLARNRDKGGYRFFDLVYGKENMADIALNLAHRDPTKREVYGNKDFRIGLSYALNRKEIIDSAYARQGKPSQSAPPPTSKFYDKEFAEQYTTYDVAKANEYLDRAGYSKRDGDGMRLGPNGKPITISISFTPDKPEWADVVQLVARYWKAVGVNTQSRSMEHSLFYKRKDINKYDAVVWDAGGLKPLLNAMHVPVGGECNYGIAWGQWYQSDGKDGQEPPDDVKAQMHLYDRALETTDAKEQDQLTRQILQVAKEQFYSIGTVRSPQGFGVVSSSLVNAPKKTFFDGKFPYPAANNLCEFSSKGSSTTRKGRA